MFQLRIIPTNELIEAKGSKVTVVFGEAKAGVFWGLQGLWLGVSNTVVTAWLVAVVWVFRVVRAVFILDWM